jgi:hypothetical protein
MLLKKGNKIESLFLKGMNDTLSKHTTKMSALQRTASNTYSDEEVIHNYLSDQFNLSKQAFNPEILKTGNEQEKQQQLQIWAKGPSSIYIQWIPDELASQEAAMMFFGNYGKVSRVDIVPKNNPFGSNKSPGNMAFIHFDSWHNATFPQRFVSAYPQHVDVEFNVTNRYGNDKLYILRSQVNTRPVAQVEFNGPQMMDMMKNLETRVKAELEAVKAELEQTRKEKHEVQQRLAMAEQFINYHYQQELTQKNDQHVIDVDDDSMV